MTDPVYPDNEHESFRHPGIPEQRPADSGWDRRLSDWHEMVSVRPHAELPQVLAGARGELSLKRVIGWHQSTRFGHVFGAKRVPRDVGSSGRYEMDLVVVTPRRVAVVEVKHWSGTLRSEGDAWVYQRRSGEVQVFDSLVDHNANKVRALQRYLGEAGLELPASRLTQLVVFTHPRLELDERLTAHPGVLTLYELQTSSAALGRGVTALEYVAAKLIERCTRPSTADRLTDGLYEMLTPAVTAGVAEAVRRLRTWDIVRLFGGRELIGDLVWVRIGGNRFGELPPGSVARLRWWRGKWWSLVPLAGMAKLGWVRGDLLSNGPLGIDDCICFHEAGRPRPSVIPLRYVDELRTG